MLTATITLLDVKWPNKTILQFNCMFIPTHSFVQFFTRLQPWRAPTLVLFSSIPHGPGKPATCIQSQLTPAHYSCKECPSTALTALPEHHRLTSLLAVCDSFLRRCHCSQQYTAQKRPGSCSRYGDYATGSTDRGSNFLCSKTSRAALGPTHRSTQWAQGFFTGDKAAGAWS